MLVIVLLNVAPYANVAFALGGSVLNTKSTTSGSHLHDITRTQSINTSLVKYEATKKDFLTACLFIQSRVKTIYFFLASFSTFHNTLLKFLITAGSDVDEKRTF